MGLVRSRRDYLYSYLSYSGYLRGQKVMDGFWKRVDAHGKERNPYQAGFLQLVCVADSESEAEERYGPHGEYFYNKMLHVYPGFADAPGYRTLATIRAGLMGQVGQFGDAPAAQSWKDLLAAGNIVAGTPSQVTEQLREVIKGLHVGHLMVLNQIRLDAARPRLAQHQDDWRAGASEPARHLGGRVRGSLVAAPAEERASALAAPDPPGGTVTGVAARGRRPESAAAGAALSAPQDHDRTHAASTRD